MHADSEWAIDEGPQNISRHSRITPTIRRNPRHKRLPHPSRRSQSQRPQPAKARAQEHRQSVTQIRKDACTQLEQTRKTNKNVNDLAIELCKLHRAGINNATNSVTVVALLFATVAFAAIFSVPGGDNDYGRNGTIRYLLHIQRCCALHFFGCCGGRKDKVWDEGDEGDQQDDVAGIGVVCTTIAFTSASYIVVGRHRKWAAMVVTIVGGVITVGVLGTMTYYAILMLYARLIKFWSPILYRPNEEGRFLFKGLVFFSWPKTMRLVLTIKKKKMRLHFYWTYILFP